MWMSTLTSGTAYLDLFKGRLALTDGRAFCCGSNDIGAAVIWSTGSGRTPLLVDKSRFAGRELTMRDFVLALGRTTSYRQKNRSAARLKSLAATDMLRQLGLEHSWETRLADLSVLDYYRLSVFRAWFTGCRLLVLDRLTEALRRQDHGPADAVRTASARAWHGGAPFRYG